jgi:hypothetical protein
MKNPGYIVKTAAGHNGTTRARDKPINGKIIVYLTDADGKPCSDEKGNQKKLLVSHHSIHIIGFND